MKQRPWLVKAVAITAIVLGGLGALTGLTGIAGLFLGKGYERSAERFMQTDASHEMVELQRQMQRDIQAVHDRWQVPHGIGLGAHVLVSGVLIVAGILVLRRRPSAREILLAVFVVGALVDLGRLYPTLGIQRDTMEITSQYMSRIFGTGPPDAVGSGFSQAMQAMTQASMVTGLGFAIVVALLKIGFFVFGAIYLTRPSARAAFEKGR